MGLSYNLLNMLVLAINYISYYNRVGDIGMEFNGSYVYYQVDDLKCE